MMRWIGISSLFTVLIYGSVYGAGRFENPWISERLGLAHYYYLEGKFDEFSKMMKEILMSTSGDSLERRNILDLFRQVQAQLGESPVPVDWKLPSQILDLEFKTSENSNPRYTEHVAELSFQSDPDFSLEVLKVAPFKGQPILDYEGRIGELERVESSTGSGAVKWNFSRYCNAELGEGLYEIQLGFQGGEPLSAWFVLTKPRRRGNPSLLARRSSWTRSSFEVFQFSSRGVPIISTLIRRRDILGRRGPSDFFAAHIPGGEFVGNGAMEATMKRHFLEGSNQGNGAEVLHLDQDRTHRFGDLIIRHQIHSEVPLDHH